jgi:hypothetical protein
MQEAEALALDQLGRHPLLAPDVAPAEQAFKATTHRDHQPDHDRCDRGHPADVLELLELPQTDQGGNERATTTTTLRNERYFHLALAARESHHSTYLSQRALMYSFSFGSAGSTPCMSFLSCSRSTSVGSFFTGFSPGCVQSPELRRFCLSGLRGLHRFPAEADGIVEFH